MISHHTIQRTSPERLTSGKIPLAITLAVVALVYSAWQYLGGGNQAELTVVPPVTSGVPTAPAPSAVTIVTIETPPAAPTSTPATSGSPIAIMPAPAPKKTGLYADGSYTGTTADAYYGSVQVQAVIQDGKIAHVKFLLYPNDRSNSRLINSQAMPLLTQEALQAQSAKVDGVSGATFTSDAFKQSLASALALAKN